MGKNKKSRQNADFVKQKRKPGKVLKKTNVTNTTFKANKLVLRDQAIVEQSSVRQYRLPTATQIYEAKQVLPELDAIVRFVTHHADTFSHSSDKQVDFAWVKNAFVAMSHIFKRTKPITDHVHLVSGRICQLMRLMPKQAAQDQLPTFLSFCCVGVASQHVSIMSVGLLTIIEALTLFSDSVAAASIVFSAVLRFVDRYANPDSRFTSRNTYTAAVKCLQALVKAHDTPKNAVLESLTVVMHVEGDQVTAIEKPSPPSTDPFSLPLLFEAAVSSPGESREGLILLTDAVLVLARHSALTNTPAAFNELTDCVEVLQRLWLAHARRFPLTMPIGEICRRVTNCHKLVLESSPGAETFKRAVAALNSVGCA